MAMGTCTRSNLLMALMMVLVRDGRVTTSLSGPKWSLRRIGGPPMKDWIALLHDETPEEDEKPPMEDAKALVKDETPEEDEKPAKDAKPEENEKSAEENETLVED